MTTLADICQTFIKSRRNFSPKGHESKFMFHVTTPFTDLEGLTFTTASNYPFDYLTYEPTVDHVFLDEQSMQAFERYIDTMFDEADMLDDWSYFKILRKLGEEEFGRMPSTVKTGLFNGQLCQDDYRLPISMIPVAEFQLIEDCSGLFNVRSINRPLDKACIRIKLNTYFNALMTLLKCTEQDLINVMYKKGILPSANFQLISTQKELTIAMKRYRSCGLQAVFEERFRRMEQRVGLLKPKYAYPHSNLGQALQQLFGLHPLYFKYQRSLQIETSFVGDGKYCLAHAVRSKKRKHVDDNSDEMSPSKKMCATTETQTDSVLADAMRRTIPELYLPEGEQHLRIELSEPLPTVIVFILSELQIKSIQARMI